MTSAHRSTFFSAKGKSEPGGHRTMQSNIISAKNMPSYLNVKRRLDNNENDEEIKYNNVASRIKSKEELKQELLQRENRTNLKEVNLAIEANKIKESPKELVNKDKNNNINIVEEDEEDIDDIEGRSHKCRACGKCYLSYPALYTHIK